MKFFIDTANIEEIRKVINSNFCSGVTTNPSLVAKENVNYINLMRLIVAECKKNSKPVSIEVFSNEKKKIYSEAIQLNKNFRYKDLHIKIPMSYDNLIIINRLVKKNIKINCTCVFSLSQALLCIQSNINIISIFFNRIRDLGEDPIRIIKIAKNIIADGGFKSKILVGSVRSVADIEESAEAGADIITIPAKLFIDSCHHKGSEISINKFLEDVKKIKK
jgi:transaldolase